MHRPAKVARTAATPRAAAAATPRLTLEQAGLWAALLQLREQQLPPLTALGSKWGRTGQLMQDLLSMRPGPVANWTNSQLPNPTTSQASPFLKAVA